MEASTYDIVGTFRRLPQPFGAPRSDLAPHSDLAPGELRPFAPPRYTPDVA